jgi:hypothetical protein
MVASLVGCRNTKKQKAKAKANCVSDSSFFFDDNAEKKARKARKSELHAKTQE